MCGWCWRPRRLFGSPAHWGRSQVTVMACPWDRGHCQWHGHQGHHRCRRGAHQGAIMTLDPDCSTRGATRASFACPPGSYGTWCTRRTLQSLHIAGAQQAAANNTPEHGHPPASCFRALRLWCWRLVRSPTAFPVRRPLLGIEADTNITPASRPPAPRSHAQAAARGMRNIADSHMHSPVITGLLTTPASRLKYDFLRLNTDRSVSVQCAHRKQSVAGLESHLLAFCLKPPRPRTVPSLPFSNVSTALQAWNSRAPV